MSGLILFMIFIDLSPYLTQQFSAYSQIYFDFGGNSSEVSYLTYDNMTAGMSQVPVQLGHSWKFGKYIW